MKLLPLALLLCAVPCAGASFRFAAIWDGAKVWHEACVAVLGDRIENVGACPDGSIDLSRYTAIPGNSAGS